jgi:hypothetical protein
MFPEEGRSGALDLEDRAALTAAIDLIATGKADGLVCYSLDRLAREITVQEAILAKVWEEAGGRVVTSDQGEILRDDPDDPMRTAMRKMAGVMYELDRRLVVARLRRGRRLKAERGGLPAAGSATGSPPNASSSCPTRPSGTSPAASVGCIGTACQFATSPSSSTPTRSQPNAAAPGTRPPSPGSSGGPCKPLLADRDPNGADRPSAVADLVCPGRGFPQGARSPRLAG